MDVTAMIYLYGGVCVSMIAFNVVYALLLRGSEPRLERRSGRMLEDARRQLARLEGGEPLEESYVRQLRRRLRRVKNLIAYERVLRALTGEGASSAVQAYLTRLQSCALYLALVYEKREDTQAAYYSYVLSRYMVHKHLSIQTLQEVLLDYVAKDNLYCRVNALQALYAFGSTEHILSALKLQDRGTVFLHEKILTEGLLTFTGDHRKLTAALWAQRRAFSPHTQLAIFNYIRFQTGDYVREMLEVMEDPEEDKELRLAAVRYFGRYPYPPALETLLRLAGDGDPLQWEYATVSVSALARYQDLRILGVLKQALHSANWYVRYAAAESLEAQQVRYEDLLDIVYGNDRYAREMITYRLEARRMRKAGV